MEAEEAQREELAASQALLASLRTESTVQLEAQAAAADAAAAAKRAAEQEVAAAALAVEREEAAAALCRHEAEAAERLAAEVAARQEVEAQLRSLLAEKAAAPSPPGAVDARAAAAGARHAAPQVRPAPCLVRSSSWR